MSYLKYTCVLAFILSWSSIPAQSRTNADVIKPLKKSSLNTTGWAFNRTSGKWESSENIIPSAHGGGPVPMWLQFDSFSEMELWHFEHQGKIYRCWTWLEEFTSQSIIAGAKIIKKSPFNSPYAGETMSYTYQRHVWVIISPDQYSQICSQLLTLDGSTQRIELHGGQFTKLRNPYEYRWEQMILKSITADPTPPPQDTRSEHDRVFPPEVTSYQQNLFFKRQFQFNTQAPDGYNVMRFRLPVAAKNLHGQYYDRLTNNRYHEVRLAEWNAFFH
ncbi:hypothetical protein [Sanyastnella coralliicola]|uniref:hypothetical protein n=1 Tax=Sanyastnella coralliicola TaxID=3069118 RepID=UPI0027B9E0A6|nr:hypothetical protein [Longitalea sp. SCSIO 12813]